MLPRSLTVRVTLAVAVPPQPSLAWYWNDADPLASAGTVTCMPIPL